MAAALFLAIQLCLMQHGRDQGIYSVVAQVMLDGGAPYRDAWDFKTPGIFFVYALGHAVFGSSMHAARVLEALAMLSMVGAFVVLSRRSFGGWLSGVLAGVVALFFHVSMGFWHTAQPESFGGPLVAWGIVLATYRSAPKDEKARVKQAIAWAGCAALFALAAIMKPPLGGGILFAFAVVATRLWRRGPVAKRGRRVGTAVMWFAAGGVVVVAATCLYIAVIGALRDFNYIFFDYIPNYTQIHFSWSGFPDLVVRVFERWPVGAHPFVWLGVLLLAIPRWTTRREAELLLLVGGAILVQVLGVALQAKFFAYHYGGLLPLAALLAVWGYAKLWRIPGARWAIAVAVVLGFHYAASQSDTIDHNRQRWEALTDAGRRQQINDRLHTIYDVNAGANRVVAEWIAENTPKDDPVYVWGFEPVIYHLANRKPASKYIYNIAQRSNWGLQVARDQLMEELYKTNPSVIVVVRRDALPHVTGNKLDSQSALKTFPRLDRFVRERYRRALVVEDLTVFKRADLLSAEVRAKLLRGID